MLQNFSTIEDLFLHILDNYNKKNNNYLLIEKKILNIYEKLNNNLLFNYSRKPSLSSKQFNLICEFIRKNKNLLIGKIISEENFKKLITEKNTKLNIYKSIEKFHYADIISENILGLYFPNSKYLKNEIKKVFNDCSIYDKELRISLVEINKFNIHEIKKFLKEHKFEISKKLDEKLKQYTSLINKSYAEIKYNNEFLKLKTLNLDPIFVKILHVLETMDDS